MQDWIRTLDADAEDLSMFYRPGVRRSLIYREISAHVLHQAQTLAPVALALYGHPLFFSTLSRMVLAGSQWLKMKSLVLPGLSSIDAIFADLQIDPGEVGLQIHEATELLLHKRSIDPIRGLLVFQPAQAGDLLHSDRASLSPFSLVTDYLLRYYPGSHSVYLVRSATEPWERATTLSVPLASIPEHGITLPADFTVYVPPL
jgi:uncharacterized protein YabN with tetrapyrrole methylase and pyrophosphatase domain